MPTWCGVGTGNGICQSTVFRIDADVKPAVSFAFCFSSGKKTDVCRCRVKSMVKNFDESMSVAFHSRSNEVQIFGSSSTHSNHTLRW